MFRVCLCLFFLGMLTSALKLKYPCKSEGKVILFKGPFGFAYI